MNCFNKIICEIYDDNPKLFGIDITGVADLINKFNVFRSFRRGSESRATAMKIWKRAATSSIVGRRRRRPGPERLRTGSISIM